MIDDITQLAANNPAFVRQTFSADLLIAAAFATWMDQFDPITVHDTDQAVVCHEKLCPLPMRIEQAKQARAIWQFRKHGLVIPLQPTVEGTIAYSFQCKQNGESNYFARIQAGLRVLLGFWHHIVNATKKLSDKIICGHEAPPNLLVLATIRLVHLMAFVN